MVCRQKQLLSKHASRKAASFPRRFSLVFARHSIPQPKDEVTLVIYADDTTVYAQSTDRKDAGARINRYLDELSP